MFQLFPPFLNFLSPLDLGPLWKGDRPVLRSGMWYRPFQSKNDPWSGSDDPKRGTAEGWVILVTMAKRRWRTHRPPQKRGEKISSKLPKTYSARTIILGIQSRPLAPYFALIIALQILSFSFINLRNHLPRRASLKVMKSLMHEPPLRKGCLTMVHFTKWYVKSSPRELHRNLLWMASSLLATQEGMGKWKKK